MSSDQQEFIGRLEQIIVYVETEQGGLAAAHIQDIEVKCVEIYNNEATEQKFDIPSNISFEILHNTINARYNSMTTIDYQTSNDQDQIS